MDHINYESSITKSGSYQWFLVLISTEISVAMEASVNDHRFCSLAAEMNPSVP